MLSLKRISLIAVVSIVLIGLTAIGFSRRGEPQDSSPSIADTHEAHLRGEQLSRLESDLAALKSRSTASTGNERMAAQLSSLEREIARLNKLMSSEARPSSTIADTVPDTSSVAEKAAEEDRQAQQFGEFLQSSLASEALDSKWANTAAQEISRGLDDATMQRTHIGDVRCGTTLCRIEASHDNVAAEQGFILQLGTLGTFQRSEGFSQRVQREDGTVSTTMFLSRSGHRLPDPSHPQS